MGAKGNWDFPSLICSKNPDETDINPFGEFRWNPEGPVSQIHSPHLHFEAPGIFSALSRSVQMLKREWGAKATGSYRTYSSLVKLQTWLLSYGGKPAFVQNCSISAWVCSERPALRQNALMMMIIIIIMVGIIIIIMDIIIIYCLLKWNSCRFWMLLHTVLKCQSLGQTGTRNAWKWWVCVCVGS